MAVDKGFEKKLKLLEQERSTLTGEIDRIGETLKSVEDLNEEL